VGVTATVVAEDGLHFELADERGFYQLTGLSPGDYMVNFYYLETIVEVTHVHVGANAPSIVDQRIDRHLAERTRADGRTMY
jgi:hypothetical protein